MIVGYARVSTTGQSLEVQLAKLKAAGCERIYSEKQSGARADNRQELQNALTALRQGDVLVVTKLDRLARSLLDLLTVLDRLLKIGAGFKVIDNPDIDTTSKWGKIIVMLIGALAELEREMILERTDEGRKAAMARGVAFGRKPKLNQRQISEALVRKANGEALVDIGKSYGVSRSTISRL
jgi:DNA invertase Pin-like site-specific DNA recombinase